MLFRLDGEHDHEGVCTVYTTMLYEQQFGSSLIKDVFGVLDLTQGGRVEVVTPEYVTARVQAAYGGALPKAVAAAIAKAFPDRVQTSVDYTLDDWDAYLRALWAMVRTSSEADGANDVPGFREWLRSIGPVDMWGVARQVVDECSRGLFRAPAQDAAGTR